MSNDPRGDSPRERFERTSFLNGANAAFVEQLYARYQQDRNSVDAEWQQFFDSLGDTREEVLNEAKGASWQRADWPVVANGELVSALDGNWRSEEHTSELQSLMRISYAVFCLKKKNQIKYQYHRTD